MLNTTFKYDTAGWRVGAHSMRDGRTLLAKEWAYDPTGEVLRKDHSLNGRTSYTYDLLRRIRHASQDEKREVFHWDGAANLVDSVQPGGYVRHNRVLVFQDRRFEYDVHGRLESKRTGAHTEQHFSYDGEHRLSHVETRRKGVTQQVHFDYDALGRRIRKHDEFGTTLFLWDGLRLLQEQRGLQAATYLYEANSYVPVARIDSAAGGKVLAEGGAAHANRKASTYYFHCDVSGLPEELSAASGELAWRAQYTVWGNTVAESWAAGPADSQAPHEQPLPQNLRLQGQYLDRECGLHYNTFRYYDPDIGHFTTPDPIGLAGGLNLYQYAPNPISWIDPWGWNSHGVYDVHGEAKLPSDMYRMSDGRHFQEANRQLYYQMKNDPQFKAAIEAKYPGTFDKVSPGRRGAFPRTAPPDLTWHHHEKVGGLLQIVDQADHNARHKDYHPTGRGGRNTWGGGSKCR